MTELEQYKKAYATLVGRVDRVITKLKESETLLNLERMDLHLAADKLTQALEEAENTILAEEDE